jgi:hypothetical protein
MNKYFQIVVIFASFFLFLNCSNKNDTITRETEIFEVAQDNYNVDTNEKNSNICSVCGNSFFGSGYEEQMDGSWKEYTDGSQGFLCSPACGKVASGKIDEVAKKYGIDMEEESSLPNTQSNGSYNVGSDGRIYENNKCSLCKGTGIEKGRNIVTGKIDERICPMCEGRGVRSY